MEATATAAAVCAAAPINWPHAAVSICGMFVVMLFACWLINFVFGD